MIRLLAKYAAWGITIAILIATKLSVPIITILSIAFASTVWVLLA